MATDDALKAVLGIFVAEAQEEVQAISAALIAMEAEPASVKERIEEFFRLAHNLKGSAASMGIEDISHLAHLMESALLPCRRGEESLRPEVVDLALRAVRAVEERCVGIQADTAQGQEEIAAATTALSQFLGQAPSPPATASPASETSADTSTSEGKPAAQEAPPGEELGGSLRVHPQRLRALEERIDDVRGLHRRLAFHASSAAQILSELRMLVGSRAAGSQGAGHEHAGLFSHPIGQKLTTLLRELRESSELAEASIRDFDEDLLLIRVVSTSLLQHVLTRTVREAYRLHGKEARLSFAGADLQIDGRCLEQLKNPLIHLVRNAVDHGLEDEATRLQQGKPRQGTVHVSVDRRGSDVVVEVHDDGRGIDLDVIRKKAVERQLVTDARVQELSESGVYELMFQPGFSTAESVTDLSGRGVGLNVVKKTLTAMHGRMQVTSTLGKGTMFRLTVPLMLAVSEAMCLEDGGHAFAIPLAPVEQALRLPLERFRHIDGRMFVDLVLAGEDDAERSALLPVLSLSRLLGQAERYQGSDKRSLVVVRSGDHRVGLMCERLTGIRELVVRPLPPELERMQLFSGLALQPDGRVAYMLSSRALAERPEAASPEGGLEPTGPPKEGATIPTTRATTVLVADDAITTRSLMRAVLEAAGYRVLTAADGEEALKLAVSESFDLVVSDIRMPKVNGYALTSALRANPRTAHVPIVLFSRLDSREDINRGTASGANAYLSKRAFDRGQVLEVIERLLKEGRGR